MVLIMLGLGALVFAIAAIQIWRVSTDEVAHRWASTLQAILTVTAFLLAAYWFFLERHGKPHADVKQTVHVQRLQPGLVAVEAHIAVENKGSTLLKIDRAQIRLQQVRPPLLDYPAVARNKEPWRLKRALEPGATEKKVVFNNAEHVWPTMLQFDRGGLGHEIEPGETDLIVATFFVSCRYEVVRVSTQVQKEPGRMWKVRTFADLTAACAGAKGGGAGGAVNAPEAQPEAEER